ncbi:HlyIII-domain-containing protein [Hesseltinella vesiculosa]|uniref:HlyIII-domain-containing protein n=1 Tax=Hesseltinella vesiculosa TaxID=101127 RepID=A0A1X2GPG8_9FUNG|nr:HlyIII-domain-containing protein [Hesseltinella vesiculosa]
MENLVTINKTACKDDVLNLDDFIHDRLGPLVHRVKFRLLHMESSKRLKDYTRDKVQRTMSMLETLDSEWRLLQLEESSSFKQPLLQQLEHAFTDLSEKYRQLEQMQGDYLETTFDDAVDALMNSIEQMDTCIADTITKAAEMRQMVHDKFQGFADLAHEHMDHLRQAIAQGAKRLLDYEEIPIPFRGNKHIRTGYRFLNTPGACFHSWLYLHNESGNIFTHLAGFVFFLGVGIYELFYSDLLTDVPVLDWFIFSVFFLAACKCLMCSTMWHTLSGINNYRTYSQVVCLDYLGISTLISASVLLCEYYGFYCNEPWRNRYLLATGTMAIISGVFPFTSWLDGPGKDLKWVRVCFFVTLASSGILPIAHLVAVHGSGPVMEWLSPVTKSLSCYAFGTLFYGFQFPERFWPGKFDHFGHSHQVWHLFVCGGIWWHYVAATKFVAQREQFGFCAV